MNTSPVLAGKYELPGADQSDSAAFQQNPDSRRPVCFHGRGRRNRFQTMEVKMAKSKTQPAQAYIPNPQPQSTPLGEASPWLSDSAKVAWECFLQECPWLSESHRSIVEVAANIRGRLIAGDPVGLQALALLRGCLREMGATPRSKTPREEESPLAHLFNL